MGEPISKVQALNFYFLFKHIFYFSFIIICSILGEIVEVGGAKRGLAFTTTRVCRLTKQAFLDPARACGEREKAMYCTRKWLKLREGDEVPISFGTR